MATRHERDLAAVEQEMGRHAKSYGDIYAKAEEAERELREDEIQDVHEHLQAIRDLETRQKDLKAKVKVDEEVAQTARKMGPPSDHPAKVPAGGGVEFQQGWQVTRPEVKSLGEIITESDQFQSLAENNFSGEFKMSWDLPAKDFRNGFQTKGTLLEGAGAPGAGTGGGLLPIPDVAPGVVNTLFQRPRVADVFPSGQTSTNTIRYIVEGTATNAAAGVTEANAKPESTLALSTVDEPVKKLATLLVASDEMLSDGPAVQSYINGRLSLFVQLKEDSALLRGGGSADIAGLAGRSGVNTTARGTVDTNSTFLFKAMNGTRGSSFLEPDAIFMHPDNWQATRLATDTAGQYFGGGPFQGPYGNGQNIGLSGQVTGATDSLWGVPVYVTTAVGNAGTAILGSFQGGAQVFRREGIRVEATNSHSTHFASNLVAIRAEERLALCVYRPGAFTLCTGLS